MKVCIIGGGGGATNAANNIRRLDENAEIHIFTDESEIGLQPCEFPYALSEELSSWDDTFVFKEKFYNERNINVHLNTEVTELDRQRKRLVANGEEYEYDKAILDLGTIPAVPPVPGLDGQNEFVLTTSLTTAKKFGEAVPKHTSAAIIGTGQIALEAAEVLKTRGYEKVYLLGRSDRVLRAYLDKEMAQEIEGRVTNSGIELILDAKINSVETSDGKKIISLPDRELEVDFVFLGTGFKPSVELAQSAGIDLGDTGGIKVNEYMQTNDPDLYAIGDCVEVWDRILGQKRLYQTAVFTARVGRLAGINIVKGNVLSYPGTVMSFVSELFGYQVGSVGFTEDYARKQGLDVVANTITSRTRRKSFDGKRITIKLVADPKTQTLLGAQIIGGELVAGKIDKLAVAIGEKVPIQRLAFIEACYSPTTGAAYEAVVMALDELSAKL
ncbi:MAG: FAD-dependent oxidoreductase [Dehalococcoidia bacterium]